MTYCIALLSVEVEVTATSRQLKTGVALNCESQLLFQGALLLVVGQLEQVEAGRRGRKPRHRVPSFQSQEPAQDRSHGVAVVLVVAHLHASKVLK